MADIAEMTLDGTLCESCGDYIGEPVGHPRDCRDCRMASGETIGDDDDIGSDPLYGANSEEDEDGDLD